MHLQKYTLKQVPTKNISMKLHSKAGGSKNVEIDISVELCFWRYMLETENCIEMFLQALQIQYNFGGTSSTVYWLMCAVYTVYCLGCSVEVDCVLCSV